MTTVVQPEVTQPLSESEFVASLRRFTVDEYRRMIDAGISPSGERVELLDGWIVWKDGAAPPADDVAAWVTPDDTLPALASLRRFTVGEYRLLLEIGILADGEPVELLEGWIVRKMGHNPPHGGVVGLIAELFAELLGRGAWAVRCQLPISLAHGAPEPDVAIVRGPSRQYVERHPEAADCQIVVEVASASLRTDRTLKAHLYAEAGIPEYWIVNVVDGTVEVRSNPVSGPEPAYRDCVARTRDERVAVVLDGRTVGELAVRDFLA